MVLTIGRPVASQSTCLASILASNTLHIWRSSRIRERFHYRQPSAPKGGFQGVCQCMLNSVFSQQHSVAGRRHPDKTSPPQRSQPGRAGAAIQPPDRPDHRRPRARSTPRARPCAPGRKVCGRSPNRRDRHPAPGADRTGSLPVQVWQSRPSRHRADLQPKYGRPHRRFQADHRRTKLE